MLRIPRLVMTALTLLICSSSYAGDFSAAVSASLDRETIDRYWDMHWRGEGDEECLVVLRGIARLFGIKPKVIPSRTRVINNSIPVTPILLPEPYVVSSKNESNRSENRGKFFQLKGRAEGVLINGKDFSEFNLIFLPQSRVPVAVLNSKRPPRGRLVLLHGLGYSISTVYSLISTAIVLKKIAEGGAGDPFATWFAQTYPELILPFQIVLMDVPPMGRAPALEDLPSAYDMAEFIRGTIGELNQIDRQNNFYISRSASGPLSILAGRDDAGVIITGPTFPDKKILNINRREVLRLEKEDGEKPDWKIIDALISKFKDPRLLAELSEVARSNLPIRAIVGADDAETPRASLWRWADLLSFGSNRFYRSQHVIQGAGHQVFRRPSHLSSTEFSKKDPDVQAYRALLEFLKYYTE